MGSKNLLSIIYLNYNGESLLPTTLPFLLASAAGHQVIVVDNGSTDNSIDIIDNYKKNYKFDTKYLEYNHGFSGGNNFGIPLAENGVIVFTSNDVIFPRFFPWQKVVERCQDDVLFGQHVVDWDGGWNKIDNKVYPYISGWFVAGNTEVWSMIGWDERYNPCDCEDVDLSIQAFYNEIPLRVQDLGAQHLGGRTVTNTDRIKTTYRMKAVLDNKWRNYGRPNA